MEGISWQKNMKGKGAIEIFVDLRKCEEYFGHLCDGINA